MNEPSTCGVDDRLFIRLRIAVIIGDVALFAACAYVAWRLWSRLS